MNLCFTLSQLGPAGPAPAACAIESHTRDRPANEVYAHAIVRRREPALGRCLLSHLYCGILS